MSNDNQSDEQAPQGNWGGGALPIAHVSDPRDQAHSGDETQTERYKALFKWAEDVLKVAGLLKVLQDAKTREELDAIEFEPGNLALIMAIRDALHPRSSRRKHFEHLNERMLQSILRNRFREEKKEQRKKLIDNEQQTAAEEEAREKREEDVKLYGEFGGYKVRDRGVFVRTIEELETGEALTKWTQISRTRIELTAVTRSRQDDNWGIYVKLFNMDGRVTRLAIPRNVINDRQGNIAGRLADLGVDVVREECEQLPDFLLTTVEVVDGNVPGRVKTLRGITAPGILRLVVTLRAKKCKNSFSAQRYNQIRFRFHTA
jgi:Domain of unknown function (DUF927)